MIQTITHSGKTRTLAEWAAILGTSSSLIRYRLSKGISVEEVLSPVRPVDNNRGDVGCRLYTIWQKNKYRCTSDKQPQYNLYGGKGITFHPEWLDYQKFKGWALSTGYTEALYLERKDVTKNYTPDNCFWSKTVNLHNQQYTSIPYKGEFLTVSEIAKRAGVGAGHVSIWIRKGKDLNSIKPAQPTPLLIINGISMTKRDWCKKYNVLYGSFCKRIRRGLTPEEALGAVLYQRKNSRYQPITHNSETHTIGQWAKLLNISRQLVYSRYDKGLPVEEILSC